VIGASGSGKSSVVRAGLIPALQRAESLTGGVLPPSPKRSWRVHPITPTEHPLTSLATSLTRDVESVTATATLVDDLAQDPRALALYARRLLSDSGHGNGDGYLLLVVDQFEELFTLCHDAAERAAFVATAVRGGWVGAYEAESQARDEITALARKVRRTVKSTDTTSMPADLHRSHEAERRVRRTPSAA